MTCKPQLKCLFYPNFLVRNTTKRQGMLLTWVWVSMYVYLTGEEE